ncbi:MAG: acyl-CoA thioesterase [Halovenus sp.]
MYSRELTVRFGDVDMFQIGFYPRLMSEVRRTTERFMESLGFPFRELINDRGVGLPIVEAGIEFESPVVVGDTLTIAVTPELGETSLRLEIEATKADGTRAFSAFEQRVCLPVDGDETVPIPADVRHALEDAAPDQQR